MLVIIRAILSRVGLSGLASGGLVTVAVIAAAAATAGAWSSYKIVSNHYAAQQLKLVRQNQDERMQAEQRLAEIEKELWSKQQEMREVYRDKIKTVVQYVDSDNCSLTADGVSIIDCAINPAACQ